MNQPTKRHRKLKDFCKYIISNTRESGFIGVKGDRRKDLEKEFLPFETYWQFDENYNCTYDYWGQANTIKDILQFIEECDNQPKSLLLCWCKVSYNSSKSHRSSIIDLFNNKQKKILNSAFNELSKSPQLSDITVQDYLGSHRVSDEMDVGDNWTAPWVRDERRFNDLYNKLVSPTIPKPSTTKVREIKYKRK